MKLVLGKLFQIIENYHCLKNFQNLMNFEPYPSAYIAILHINNIGRSLMYSRKIISP